MNRYFLDTNALVKRYHQEDGSDVIDRVFAEPDVHLVISDISIIEFYSAMALKVRTGNIHEDDFGAFRKVFSQDVKDGVYEVVEFTQQEKTEATNLLITYGTNHSLKTLDAIQLALMKFSDPQKLQVVVCADDKFCRIIALEGLRTLNPMKGGTPEQS